MTLTNEHIKFIQSDDWKKISRKRYFREIIRHVLIKKLNMKLESQSKEVLYWYLKNISEYPKCVICNNDIVGFRPGKYSYLETCSKKSCADKIGQIKIKLHKNYEELKIKAALRLRKGYDEKKQEIKRKVKQTNLKNLGVENPMQNKEIRNKVKQTMLKRYGVENPMQNKEIRKRASDTYKERTGYTHPMKNPQTHRKYKETCKKNHGVEYPMQSKKIQEKTKRTNNKKYGVDWNISSNYSRNKQKETNIERYGKEYPTQSKKIQEKTKRTNIEKYGVENPSQVAEFHDKKFKSKNYIMPSGVVRCVQGYEPFVIDILLEIYEEDQILTDVIDMPEIWYEFEGKQHRYFCDIFIPSENKLIEVKSEYTYNTDKERNLMKQHASIDYGFEHEIWVITKKGKLEEIL